MIIGVRFRVDRRSPLLLRFTNESLINSPTIGESVASSTVSSPPDSTLSELRWKEESTGCEIVEFNLHIVDQDSGTDVPRSDCNV